MTWTLLGDTIPNPLPVTDNSGSLTVDGSVSTSGAYTELTGSATATGTVIASTDVRGYSAVSLQLVGGSASNTFQVQNSLNGTDWFPVYGISATNSGSSSAYGRTDFNNSHPAILVPVIGRYLRLQCTSYSSGTTVCTLALRSDLAVPPMAGLASAFQGGVPVHVVSIGGTATATVDTELPAAAALSDTMSNPTTPLIGSATSYYNGSTWTRVAPGAGLPVAGQYVSQSASASANNTDLVAATDVRAYRSFAFQMTGTFSATVQVQGSNDNASWQAVPVYQLGTSPTFATSFSSAAIYVGSINFRYLRIRTTAYTSGTINGYCELSAHPAPALNTFVGNTPTVFKTATATASGSTALWTPTTGKKFRVMRYQVLVPSSAAMSPANELSVYLFDGASQFGPVQSLYLPATSQTTSFGGWNSGWIDLGNGLLSAAANNVLNVNLSAALTASYVRVNVCGTEE